VGTAGQREREKGGALGLGGRGKLGRRGCWAARGREERGVGLCGERKSRPKGRRGRNRPS
jgi:hypothetical protein